ncbi:MAG: cupin-like domain-containing protein [Saprospiraceae bacterium]|nr:cupin-like domain-containing protein [Saprospiraceae bacterium]
MKREANFKYITRSNRILYGVLQTLDHFLGRSLAFKLTKPLRTKLYDSLERQLKKGGQGKVIDVDRVQNISEAKFKQNYLLKNKPVIFEGQALEWACVQNWSLEYLKKLYGDDKIVMVNQEDVNNSHEELTLGELIDGIHNGLAKYYRFYPLIQRHPERLLDFDFKWMKKHRNESIKYDAFQVFIGPNASYTPLHNANPGNIFTQVFGEKEWMLIPPEYSVIVDANPIKSNYRSAPIRKEYGPYNPFEPDHTRPYHLYQYCERYRAILKPGDVLFVPPYWWHAVRNFGDTIGVGYRWLPLWFNFKHHPLHSFLDLCTTRPPVWKTWKLSQIDPNLTHMAEVGKLKEYMKNQNK